MSKKVDTCSPVVSDVLELWLASGHSISGQSISMCKRFFWGQRAERERKTEEKKGQKRGSSLFYICCNETVTCLQVGVGSGLWEGVW